MRTAYIYNILHRWIFLLGVVLLIIMNLLSNALPFGGMTMAAISEKYTTLITPAGYAFSIWGVIYTALAIFAYFQLTKGKEIRFYSLVWPYFIVNVFANVTWLIAFQNEWIGLSLVLMLVILGSLIAIMRLFYRLKNALSTTHRYFFQVPFSLYLGWITVATMVNFAVFFVADEMVLFTQSPELYAIILLVIGTLISLYFLMTQQDYIFTFAVVWAYIGIWVVNSESDAVMHTAKFSAIALLAAAVIAFINDRIKVAQYGKSSS